MSSRAYLVDLIHSISEKTALVDHLEEKLDKNEPNKELEGLIKRILDLRRSQMNQLLECGQNPNPEYWCAFKHAVTMFKQDTEVYEATFSDESRKNMIKSADILASMISLFLGMEFETCARCLYDKMLVEQIESSNQS